MSDSPIDDTYCIITHNAMYHSNQIQHGVTLT